MNYRSVIQCLLLFFLSLTTSYAQHRVSIIDPEIKSVQAYANQDITSFPCIYLGSNEYITIAFDDLNKEPRNLMYKIIHCDESWIDEELFQSSFLDGFQEHPLYCNSYSNNTIQKYSHYTINFPNNDVKAKISGNYMLIIFDADSQQSLLKVGFLVSEKVATQVASLIIPTNSSYQTSHHLNLSVQFHPLNISNPTREIKTLVYQNYVLLPDSLQPQPTGVNPNSILYSRADKNIYPAGNEFRTIDIRDAHYTSTNVRSSRQVQGQYYLLLQPDLNRSNLSYSNSYDYNGKMIIAGLNNITDPNTDCDYYSVMFSLSSPYLGDSYDIYIEGELTGWEPSNQSKMLYNKATSCYEVPLLLKQGFYSYQYVVRNRKGEAIQHLSPEGNFSQTENSYQICTYYKGIRDPYTRLIACKTIEEGKRVLK